MRTDFFLVFGLPTLALPRQFGQLFAVEIYIFLYDINRSAMFLWFDFRLYGLSFSLPGITQQFLDYHPRSPVQLRPLFIYQLVFLLPGFLLIYLPIYPSTNLSTIFLFFRHVCLSTHLCIYLSVYLFVYLSVYSSVYLFVLLPIYLSIHVPTYLTNLSIYLFTYLSTYLPMYLCTYLPIYLSISLSLSSV